MFDVDETVKAITELHLKRRKRKFQPSKLDAHAHCILALHRAGLSLSQLQLYLEQVGVKAARSTIHYWLKKHGEIRFG